MQNQNLQQRIIKPTLRLYPVFMAVILGMATCVSGAQDQATQERPLGELAHKKSTRKAKTVITNDDLPSRPAESSQPVTGSAKPQAANGEDSPSEGHAPNSANDPEAKAPGSLAEAKSMVETLKVHEQHLIRRYDELQRKLSETDNEQLRRVYSDALAGREENLVLVHKQIEEAEKAVHLAEEAGKAQGDQSNAPK